MTSLEENLDKILPLLEIIEKEGLDNTIKFLRVLMPYKLKEYMIIVYELKRQVNEKTKVKPAPTPKPSHGAPRNTGY